MSCPKNMNAVLKTIMFLGTTRPALYDLLQVVDERSMVGGYTELTYVVDPAAVVNTKTILIPV